MRKLQVRRPVLLLAVLILLLLHDHSGFARIALASALLHESGHVLVYWQITGEFPVLTLSLTGIGLRPGDFSMTPGQLLWLAAAGPLANLAMCIVTLLLLRLHASYSGYFWASANLCTGLFNLLPVGSLDGRRILQTFRHKK